jgi:hypothetical protein
MGNPATTPRSRGRNRATRLAAQRAASAVASEPPSWAAAWRAAEATGDVQALSPTPVPSLDNLCGIDKDGRQGRMYCQGGVCFCRWEP